MEFPCSARSIIVAEIAGNKFLSNQNWWKCGGQLSTSELVGRIAGAKLFPDLFTDMLSVGEQTGRFAETMQIIAECLRTRAPIARLRSFRS